MQRPADSYKFKLGDTMNPRYLLLLLVVCLLIGGVQAWGVDMGAWDYRKEITVNNTGAELTNYQLKFTINRDTGADSGFTVYVDGKCESDYDDIRFTTGENTLCDYWIESASSSTATIWVEVPTIAAEIRRCISITAIPMQVR